MGGKEKDVVAAKGKDGKSKTRAKKKRKTTARRRLHPFKTEPGFVTKDGEALFEDKSRWREREFWQEPRGVTRVRTSGTKNLKTEAG